MKNERLKQVIMSILIGTAISLLTVLCQELITWLQSFDATTIGVTAGIARNIYVWRTPHIS